MRAAVTVGIVLVLLWGGIKIATNESAKADPPAACQFFGGTWNIWDGWQCS